MSRASGKAQVLAMSADSSTPPSPETDAVAFPRTIAVNGQTPVVDLTASGDTFGSSTSGAAPTGTVDFAGVEDLEGATASQGFDAWVAGDVRKFVYLPEGNVTGKPQLAFDGWVSTWSKSGGHDAAHEVTVQIQLTSSPVWTAITAGDPIQSGKKAKK